MRGFGSRSGRGRGSAGRQLKAAKRVEVRDAPRAAVPARATDAELGRATRGLVGPASGGPRSGDSRSWRRAGRIVTPARAAGLLGLLATGFMLTLVTGPTAFGLARTELPSLRWTDPEAVRAALAIAPGANLFQLDTAPIEAALSTLPAVASAEVAVSLPDAVVVHIEERRPVLAWQVESQRFLADGAGVIFAIVDTSTSLPDGVAIVDDRRQPAVGDLRIGGRLDAVDLDVATRLGSVTPGDIGSAAARLRVTISETDGYVLSTPDGWAAVFGFYSPATRPTSIIPGQVRLLKSLLAGREPTIRRVILASETDGTYVPVATPRPSHR